MSVLSVLAVLAALWWAVVMGLVLGSAVLAGLPNRERRGRPRPLSVLIPLREDHPGLAAATASVRQAAPEAEIILSATEDQSPALHRAARAAGTPVRVLSTRRQAARNPKIANLVEPLNASRHETVLIKDGLSRIRGGSLAAMLAALDGPGVGLVSAVPIARTPASFAAWVECALINTHGARLLTAAARLGHGFGIGAAMLMRRPDLERAGGLLAADTVADDAALARALAGVGLRTVLAGHVDQDLGTRRMAEVFRRHARWALCRRIEAPLAFAAEPLTGLPAGCLSAAAASPPAGLSPAVGVLATLLIWIAAEMTLAIRQGWPAGWRSPAAILVRELLLPGIWITALGARSLCWGTELVPLRSITS